MESGVDVKITIFCDYRQLSGKIGVFLKTYIHMLRSELTKYQYFVQ
jgi:hypothetical protein